MTSSWWVAAKNGIENNGNKPVIPHPNLPDATWINGKVEYTPVPNTSYAQCVLVSCLVKPTKRSQGSTFTLKLVGDSSNCGALHLGQSFTNIENQTWLMKNFMSYGGFDVITGNVHHNIVLNYYKAGWKPMIEKHKSNRGQGYTTLDYIYFVMDPKEIVHKGH